MRDPTMHIRLSVFTDILKQMEFPNADKLAYKIFSRAVPHAVNTRHLVEGNALLRAKARRAISAAKANSMTVERFHVILDSVRRACGHKFFKPIRKGTGDFILLQEIAGQALEFCTECGFESYDEGCRVYLTLGIDLMRTQKQYALGKYKFYDAKIYSHYESLYMINNDQKPKTTRAFHDCYVQLLAEYAGVTRELTKPEDYISFVLARMEAEKSQAHPEDWLRAQFDELKRMFDSVPNPNQLFSDNATVRYYAYMRSAHKDVEETIVVRPKSTDTSFESRYAQKLRDKFAGK